MSGIIFLKYISGIIQMNFFQNPTFIFVRMNKEEKLNGNQNISSTEANRNKYFKIVMCEIKVELLLLLLLLCCYCFCLQCMFDIYLDNVTKLIIIIAKKIQVKHEL